ncbi:hypothetical protein IEO21_04764 [Rhodonia placenta]|uniref:Alpha/beta hydrolase fold-3 domain-containing protein n=1 Tax=Rhodonia placenta TaxID=104341 RepID=A0A8H7P378_9APHY|nr:hypothetical protein IEO21_04764 [Postia placenta]
MSFSFSLSSLLLIFFVEYISTSFVDRLQSYSSPVPSPSSTPSRCSSPIPPYSSALDTGQAPITSPAQLPSPVSSSSVEREDFAVGHTADAPLPLAPPESAAEVNDSLSTSSSSSSSSSDAHERTPLRAPSHAHAHPHPDGTYGSTRSAARNHAAYAHTFPRSTRRPRRASDPSQGPSGVGVAVAEIFAGGHHRHEARGAHASHHGGGKGAAWRWLFGLGAGEPSVRPVLEDGEVGVERHVRNEHSGHMEAWGSGEQVGGEELDETEMQVGRRRQIIGILMLEIGIMLHSLVIGLTLAITSGPEYTSLATAIMFHQLFEGLSLGIRIATLSAVSNAKEKITLIRGLMSALSAGMLIYAACVEMLAGDFVLDPHLWRTSVRRQALALGSLLLGVVAMGAVGTGLQESWESKQYKQPFSGSTIFSFWFSRIVEGGLMPAYLDYCMSDRMQTAVGKKAPVLFYVYGGGFIMGSRISPPPYDLSFTNLGAFFAYAGIIAVIPDYRLVPEVKHPQGVEDVRDAIAWTVDHASEIFVQEGSSVQPDLDRIFVLGHSAGAIHAATLVLLPGLLHPGLRQRIRGVILQCGQYDLSPPRPGQEQAVMEKYYGTAEVMRVGSPRFLLEQAAASSSSTLMVFPKVLVTHGEWEPSDVIQQSEQFALALREKLGDGGEIELRDLSKTQSPPTAFFAFTFRGINIVMLNIVAAIVELH